MMKPFLLLIVFVSSSTARYTMVSMSYQQILFLPIIPLPLLYNVQCSAVLYTAV